MAPWPGPEASSASRGVATRQRLFVLAFDHRNSLRSQFFGFPAELSAAEHARLVEAKQIIFDGCLLAVGTGLALSEVAVLVDEQFGADVAREARAKGVQFAMPVEMSGRQEFSFEYGRAFGEHLEAFEPTYAKVLVRFNPDLPGEINARQLRRLQVLMAWLRQTGRKLMFELLVPPLPAQLAAVGGDQKRFDEEVRPGLMVEAIKTLHEKGIEPAIWKIEGFDAPGSCHRVARQARSEGRDDVGCIVLGRGADATAVERWLRAAAGVAGFVGFAVGRTIWWDALKAFSEGAATRHMAVRSIADNYLRMVHVYEAAE